MFSTPGRVIGAVLLTGLAAMFYPSAASAHAIAPGDILVYQVGDSTDSGEATGSALYIQDLNPSSPGTAPVQTWDISTESNPLYSLDNAPVGSISLSDNGTEVSFTGWTQETTSGSLDQTLGISRGVGVINTAGIYSQPMTINPSAFDSTADYDVPDAAFSPDGANWFIGDTSGLFYNNGTSPIPTTLADGLGKTGNYDTVAIRSFGSNTFVIHSVSLHPALGEYTLSTISPSTIGPSSTGFEYTSVLTTAILMNDISGPFRDFYMVSSLDRGSVNDTMYVASATEIYKFGLLGTAWTYRARTSRFPPRATSAV